MTSSKLIDERADRVVPDVIQYEELWHFAERSKITYHATQSIRAAANVFDVPTGVWRRECITATERTSSRHMVSTTTQLFLCDHSTPN
jgi:hypothetical protein